MRSSIVIRSLLVALVIAVYWGSLDGGFVSDDWPFIGHKDATLGRLASIPGFFAKGVWASSATGVEGGGLYRPLWLLWMFSIYQFAGKAAMAWHLVSLGLHAANVLLVFSLIGRVFPATTQTERGVATALFAASPLATESVAWVSGSTDLLVTCLLLLSMLAYAEHREKGRILPLVSSVVAFGAALLTKETAVVFPAILILYDLHQTRRTRPLPYHTYAALGIITALYLIVRTGALWGTEGGTESLVLDGESVVRLVEYGLLYLRYLVLPWPHPYYLRHVPGGIAGGVDVALGVLALLGFALLAVRWRSGRLPLAWLLLPIAPPLILALHAYGWFGLRYLYLPAAGGALLVAGALVEFRARWRGVGTALAGATAIAFAVLSAVISLDWKDEPTWARKVLAHDPQSVLAYRLLARAHLRDMDHESAVAAYDRGLSAIADPDGRAALAMRKAYVLLRRGRLAESLEAYERLATQTGYEAAGYVGVGMVLISQGHLPDALDAFEAALTYAPRDGKALAYAGRLSEELGDRQEASRYYHRLLELPEGERPSFAAEWVRTFRQGGGP